MADTAATLIEPENRSAAEPSHDASVRFRRMQARALAGLALLAAIYSLALAKTFFIPIVLALLLSLVLAPAVVALERWHVPRALGAGILVLALVAGVGAGVNTLVHPLGEWIDRAPHMLNQLERKIYPIKKTVAEVNRTADKVERIAAVDSNESKSAPLGKNGITLRDVLYANARGLVVNLVMVTFLLYFFLAWGRVMLSRISVAVGDSARGRRLILLSTDLQGQMSKYLVSITLINTGLGLVVAATLYLLGMPNPLLWGAVAGLLNFIPYLGSVATAILLGGAALLAFDGLVQAGSVVVVFAGLTVLEGQIVTPLILGRNLALNPLIIFVSVVFWFWLWGMMGALMAVPILVALKIAGDHVPSFAPVARIAGR